MNYDLVEQFELKLTESYANTNVSEFEYAFRNKTGDVKDWGKAIREIRPKSVPVELDLKVTVNGQEVKDENEPRDKEGGDEERSENCT